MRNGTLPARILHDIHRRSCAVISSHMLVQRYGSPQAVSRALRRLVEDRKIERVERGLYRVLPNQAPKLAFDRAWSNPGADLPPERRIAVTLARPTFQDVARLCRAYGVVRVRAVLDDLERNADIPANLASDWRHRLDNIEKGFRDAAHRLLARGNEAAAVGLGARR